MTEQRSFFSELKRRNVYKVAVAYVVVSWLIIQAASIVLPTFEAPVWVMKVLISTIVLGFPIALAFSLIPLVPLHADPRFVALAERIPARLFKSEAHK
jgi:hypothetical protein